MIKSKANSSNPCPQDSAQNPSSFEALFYAYSDAIYRFLYWRCGRNDTLAKDLTQEVFYQAFCRFELLNWDKPFPLLCSIARNVFANYFRSAARNLKKLKTWQGSQATAAKESETVQESMERQEEVSKIVQEGFAALPPRYTEVLQMKYQYNYSVEEIAEQFTTSVKAVESLLSRARKKFMRAVGNHNIGELIRV